MVILRWRCRYLALNQALVLSWWRMQRIEEEEYGGTQALMGEGLPPSIGLFVVRFCILSLQHSLGLPMLHRQLSYSDKCRTSCMTHWIILLDPMHLRIRARAFIAFADYKSPGWLRDALSPTCIEICCSLSGSWRSRQLAADDVADHNATAQIPGWMAHHLGHKSPGESAKAVWCV